MKKVFATRGQILAIGRELDKQLVKAPDGLCIYAVGESDQTVAERLGCNATHVRKIRREEYGQLRHASPPAEASAAGVAGLAIAHSALHARVGELESRLAALERQIRTTTLQLPLSAGKAA